MEFSKKQIEKWLPHMAGLLLFIILPLFVFDSDNGRAIFWIYSYYYQLAFMLIAFYVNYLVIVPRFFFSSKKYHFFIILFLFAVLLLAISQYIYDAYIIENLRPEDAMMGDKMRPKSRFGMHPKLVDNFLLLLIVLGFSSGVAIIQQLRKNELAKNEIEKARVDSELAFLKNQISPHFFFNALNNIYGLIAIDGDKAQKAVEKLSGLMRYLIYESDIETIEIKKEFEFTLKYVELMQHRISSKVKLDVDISDHPASGQIPPLLFIPFVENAFKHGISYRENSFISLHLKTEESRLVFESKNSIPKNADQKDKKGGVGIVNIKKRLELIYGQSFELELSTKEDVYYVRLIVPLNQKTDA